MRLRRMRKALVSCIRIVNHAHALNRQRKIALDMPIGTATGAILLGLLRLTNRLVINSILSASIPARMEIWNQVCMESLHQACVEAAGHGGTAFRIRRMRSTHPIR